MTRLLTVSVDVVLLTANSTFEHAELCQYDCGQQEISAVHTLLVPHEGAELPCFAVGACGYKAGEKDPTDGHLRIFWVHGDYHGSSTKLAPAASMHVNGCISAFTDINGMLAVAVNSSVCLTSIQVRMRH